MDTKPLEHEALDQIKALLSRYNYRFVEMNFDENGADIFIVIEIEDESAIYLKCIKGQSKGRCITNDSSEVVIPCRYVTDNFIAFVYVKKECEEENEAEVYLYSAEDIRNDWTIIDAKFRLYIPKDFNHRQENNQYRFNKKRATIIGDTLNRVGEMKTTSDIRTLSDAEFYFEMWGKTGGLPSYEYIKDVLQTESSDSLLDTGKFIFLLCASLIVNKDKADTSLSIDWSFYSLSYLDAKMNLPLGYKKGDIFFSDVAITYSNTWVQEVLSEEDAIVGYHLHIGDKEETVDAFIMKDGRYGVEYNTNNHC
mgnify:CR=1 FL=1